MEADEYARLDETEAAHWWFAAIHALVVASLRRRPGAPGLPWLDAGCGTGGLLAHLEAAFPARPLIGIDIAAAALMHARAKTGAGLLRGSVDALPIADASVGAAVAIDVLCHRAVDPGAALAELRRVLAPGGALLINMPAHRWLHSVHDERVHNRRRFARREIQDMLAAAGFEAIDAHHWNSLPFPALLLQRKVLTRFARGPARSDVAPVPVALDRCMRAVMRVERELLSAGLRLPFGGSILAAARRPAR